MIPSTSCSMFFRLSPMIWPSHVSYWYHSMWNGFFRLLCCLKNAACFLHMHSVSVIFRKVPAFTRICMYTAWNKFIKITATDEHSQKMYLYDIVIVFGWECISRLFCFLEKEHLQLTNCVWTTETAFYALKRLQTKKRKIVDRRASKSRKIR